MLHVFARLRLNGALILCCFFTVKFASAQEWRAFPDSLMLGEFYRSRQLTACLLVKELNSNEALVWNSSLMNQRFSPASTFKIPNMILGFIAGNLQRDSDNLQKWDGVQRALPQWNRDLTLKEAFRLSAVWYFQNLARKAGTVQMERFLKVISYGNMHCSGAVDAFWLNDTLKISPLEQMEFLQRLIRSELPCDTAIQRSVREIMFEDERNGVRYFSKTGWTVSSGYDQGWYVGWAEYANRVWVFVHHIQSNSESLPDHFAASRIEAVVRVVESTVKSSTSPR
jgi:beta-lactamase class D